jgi:hypothetical protein
MAGSDAARLAVRPGIPARIVRLELHPGLVAVRELGSRARRIEASWASLGAIRFLPRSAFSIVCELTPKDLTGSSARVHPRSFRACLI